MILTTPLFSGLKQSFPDSHITVLTSPGNDIIAKHNKNVDNTIIFNKTISGYVKLFLQFRKHKFDYWIDTKPEFSNTSTTLLKFARYGKSIGYNTKGKYFDTDLSKIKNGKHYTEINTLPLKILSPEFKMPDLRPEIDIPDEKWKQINAILSEYPKEFVIFNLSVKDATRNWNLQDVLSIYNQFKTRIPFVFQYVEKDRPFFEEIKSKTGDNLMYFDGGILELAGIVSKAKLVITPDTSLIHIASAFNVPVVGIYHNVDWNLRRFAPLSDRKVVLVSDEKNKIRIDADKICESINSLL
ncbi:MAG: glycosyltransferase family 9 protein [Bacteroidetes bacterium]|nr:glycosyltransferase family 9 protein [Bacteroidota bacterium]